MIEDHRSLTHRPQFTFRMQIIIQLLSSDGTYQRQFGDTTDQELILVKPAPNT